MNTKWRELDLDGGGLQAANLRLARMLRRRTVAYGLLLVFPLGAHRWYLAEPRSAILYPVLSTAAATAGYADMTVIMMAALLALAALLAWDLYTLEDRIVAFNKRQRMAVYLSGKAGAPAGFRSRFEADDTPAGTTDAPRRVPTLAEQEALLRTLAARDKNQRKTQ